MTYDDDEFSRRNTTMQKLARGVNLSNDEVTALTALAKKFRAHSRSGPTTGEPSWRVLVMAIAGGEITLTRAHTRPILK